jgi:hypothetical protein
MSMASEEESEQVGSVKISHGPETHPEKREADEMRLFFLSIVI